MNANSEAAATRGISIGSATRVRSVLLRRVVSLRASAKSRANTRLQSKHQAGDDGAGGVDQGVDDGGGEMRITEQAGVIPRAQMRRTAKTADGQGGSDDLDHGPVGEGQQKD